MTDIPRRAVTRTARLATLPIGFAGRTAVGFGKRVGGKPADAVLAEVQARTAEQMFRVLGELKGGAMKFGQGLSVFEAALPEDMAAPYRAALTKLQEAAPPLPADKVHAVLAEQLGPRWRSRFAEFDDAPAAAASIGQVHAAVWRDGRPVAVKIQYPGAGDALLSDLNQIGRMGRIMKPLAPGLDLKPLLDEMRARMSEELDYTREARNQHAFAKAFRDDPDFVVPDVVAKAERVIVTEWVDGTPLSSIIASGTPLQRDRAGQLLVRLLFSSPARVGLLHADPHPGNFRLDGSGRLAVMDFGAVNELPDGLPASIGPLARLALEGDAEAVLQGLRTEGFVRDKIDLDAETLLAYLVPLLEPIRGPEFRFTRRWLRAETARLADLRQATTGMKLNLPPSYMLIHRVVLGTMGVLCQLDALAPYRAEIATWVPGFVPGHDPGHPRPRNRRGGLTSSA